MEEQLKVWVTDPDHAWVQAVVKKQLDEKCVLPSPTLSPPSVHPFPCSTVLVELEATGEQRTITLEKDSANVKPRNSAADVSGRAPCTLAPDSLCVELF
jgi:hypothetical protein